MSLRTEDARSSEAWRLRGVERAVEQDEGRITYDRAEKFLAEFSEARQTQARLLEDLRRSDILGLIEVLTGVEIPPIGDDHKDHLHVSNNSVKEALSKYASVVGFVVYMSAPTLSNRYGLWDKSVHLYAIQVPYIKRVPPHSPNGRGMLALRYGGEGNLQINGRSFFSRNYGEGKSRDEVHTAVTNALTNGFSADQESRIAVTTEGRVLNAYMLDS
ncbi:MAG: hypothetical protein Q7S79_03105 [bacterium]|nr:hypothetical protein [bacterium]